MGGPWIWWLVVMTHCNVKDGGPKLIDKCTLPLTAFSTGRCPS